MDAAATAASPPRPLRAIREPKVYLVGRQTLVPEAIDRFLGEHGLSWSTDTEVGAEALAEMAGRVCYMSYGKGRKTNAEFVGHIIDVGHGSVLEHAVWSFIITGLTLLIDVAISLPAACPFEIAMAASIIERAKLLMP